MSLVCKWFGHAVCRSGIAGVKLTEVTVIGVKVVEVTVREVNSMEVKFAHVSARGTEMRRVEITEGEVARAKSRKCNLVEVNLCPCMGTQLSFYQKISGFLAFERACAARHQLLQSYHHHRSMVKHFLRQFHYCSAKWQLSRQRRGDSQRRVNTLLSKNVESLRSIQKSAPSEGWSSPIMPSGSLTGNSMGPW